MIKICFKCKKEKNIDYFYRHPQTKDGHLGKCIECTKKDSSVKTIERECFTCSKKFYTNITSIKKSKGITCSRYCFYKRLIKIIKREEQSPNWKGNEVGKGALHDWVKRQLGKPKKCSKCCSTNDKKYEWANISRKYKRELSDWIRLCRKCHIIFDGSKCQKNYKRLNYKDFLKIKV